MSDKIEQLVELALEVELTDPIDWGMLAIDESAAYRMVAATVVEMDSEPLVLKASLVKLLVENFVLNLKLLECIGNK